MYVLDICQGIYQDMPAFERSKDNPLFIALKSFGEDLRNQNHTSAYNVKEERFPHSHDQIRRTLFMIGRCTPFQVMPSPPSSLNRRGNDRRAAVLLHLFNSSGSLCSQKEASGLNNTECPGWSTEFVNTAPFSLRDSPCRCCTVALCRCSLRSNSLRRWTSLEHAAHDPHQARLFPRCAGRGCCKQRPCQANLKGAGNTLFVQAKSHMPMFYLPSERKHEYERWFEVCNLE